MPAASAGLLGATLFTLANGVSNVAEDVDPVAVALDRDAVETSAAAAVA